MAWKVQWKATRHHLCQGRRVIHKVQRTTPRGPKSAHHCRKLYPRQRRICSFLKMKVASMVGHPGVLKFLLPTKNKINNSNLPSFSSQTNSDTKIRHVSLQKEGQYLCPRCRNCCQLLVYCQNNCEVPILQQFVVNVVYSTPTGRYTQNNTKWLFPVSYIKPNHSPVVLVCFLADLPKSLQICMTTDQNGSTTLACEKIPPGRTNKEQLRIPSSQGQIGTQWTSCARPA